MSTDQRIAQIVAGKEMLVADVELDDMRTQAAKDLAEQTLAAIRARTEESAKRRHAPEKASSQTDAA